MQLSRQHVRNHCLIIDRAVLLAVLSSGASSRGELIEARRFGRMALALNIVGIVIVTTPFFIAILQSLASSFFIRTEECGNGYCWFYEACHYNFFEGYHCE